ncbi:MAG: IclR family transcriptional regulator [SAR324 cluster bacterium]|nr:IclR family transcriptional regulator [SAR324 cluster bacterium]
MNSIQKTLSLLELISNSPSGLRLPEIAPHLGISVPAAHNYTKSFIQEGFLVKDKETGKFKTTFKIVKLGFTVLKSNSIIEFTTPVLKQLSEEIGSSVHIAIRERNLGLCINKAGPYHTELSIPRIGTEFALYPTALGRAILAFLSPAEIAEYFESVELLPFTKRTVTSKVKLTEILKETKKRGFSLDFEEHKIGLCSMGVPILDRNSEVRGALSSMIPFSSTQKEQSQNSKILKKYSLKLTELLDEIMFPDFY